MLLVTLLGLGCPRPGGPPVDGTSSLSARGVSAVPGPRELPAALHSSQREQVLVAIQSVQRLQVGHAERADLAYDLGVGHARLGDRDASRAAWTRAVELEPALACGWYDLAVLDESEVGLERALERVREGRRHGDHPALRASEVRLLASLGREEEAWRAAREALWTAPGDLDVYLGMVDGLLASGQGERAWHLARLALVEAARAWDQLTTAWQQLAAAGVLDPQSRHLAAPAAVRALATRVEAFEASCRRPVRSQDRESVDLDRRERLGELALWTEAIHRSYQDFQASSQARYLLGRATLAHADGGGGPEALD